MAMRFFKRRDPGVAMPTESSSNNSNAPISETKETAISGYPDDSKYDAEKGDFSDSAYNGAPRKGSRINAPMRKGSIVTGDYSSDEEGTSMSIAAQIEAEKDNAIKYRTCSWYKVSTSSNPSSFCLEVLCVQFVLRAHLQDMLVHTMHSQPSPAPEIRSNHTNSRPQPCYSLSTSLWLSCLSPTLMPTLVSLVVSS